MEQSQQRVDDAIRTLEDQGYAVFVPETDNAGAAPTQSQQFYQTYHNQNVNPVDEYEPFEATSYETDTESEVID
jgi:hypothetical protein